MKSRKMKHQSNEARRSFLKKAAYAAPVVMALGALVVPMSAHASSLGKSNSKANNGFGNDDQTAPGNSGSHNNAENSQKAAAEKAAEVAKQAAEAAKEAAEAAKKKKKK